MRARVHIATKKAPTLALKPKGARLLQRRNLDQIQPEAASTAAEERLSTPDQANRTSSPLTPTTLGHNLGRMTVWPGASSVIQPILTAGQPHDHSIQRMCPKCEEKVQRLADDKQADARLQAQLASGQSVNAPTNLQAQISALHGGGQPLLQAERAFFEPRFGVDFSQVRLHTNGAAAKTARAIQARAFTLGQHVVFGAGQYAPEAAEGRRLLAHELTHVVQQGTHGSRVQAKKLSKEEKEADLQSDDLKHDHRLQSAFDNSPVLSSGETSEGAKTLQRALKKLNYSLPISFAKTGDADGIFGKETHDVLYQFQVDHTLQQKDGIAGRETLDALDQALLGAQQPLCNIKYNNGSLGPKEKSAFIQNNFSAKDRPGATKILDDLCEVTGDVLSFESEPELRDEVLKRLRISQYLQQSQTSGAFAYPENSKACPGKIGDSLLDAQVNKDAKEYWKGPILEQRASVKNRHYYFELSDPGKENGYQALKKLFTPQANICDKTLIHCDSLITLVKALAYADTIGEQQFNEKIKSGQLHIWLTYDGMSIKEGDSSDTPGSIAYYQITPSSKQNLLIGDHVIFWNHLAYDAISVTKPGPWRLENALLVDKDSSGNDLYEGHGAPEVDHTVKPGKEEEVLQDLMDVYNGYVKDAKSIANKVDNLEPTAPEELNKKYPQVKKMNNIWAVEELDRNKDRPQHYYVLREITDVKDNELIGLRNPYNPSAMNSVTRPVESK